MATFMTLPVELRLQILIHTLPEGYEPFALTCRENHLLAKAHLAAYHGAKRKTFDRLTFSFDYALHHPHWSLISDKEVAVLAAGHTNVDLMAKRDGLDHLFFPINRRYVRSITLRPTQSAPDSWQGYIAFIARLADVTNPEGAGRRSLGNVQVSDEHWRILALDAIFRAFPNVSTVRYDQHSQFLVGWTQCDDASVSELTSLPASVRPDALLNLRTLTLRRVRGATLALPKIVWLLQLPSLQYLYVGGLDKADKWTGQFGCLKKHYHPSYSLRDVQLDFDNMVHIEAIATFLSQMVAIQTYRLTSSKGPVRSWLTIGGVSVERMRCVKMRETVDHVNRRVNRREARIGEWVPV